MNVADLYEQFVDQMDDSADAPADTDRRWPLSPFFYRELNRAEAEAAQRAKLLWDQTTPAVCSITLASGTRGYALSAKILQLENVWYQDVPIAKTRRDDIEGALPTGTGTPTEYFVRNRMLYVNPIPGAAEDATALTLGVYRLPLTSLSALTDEPEIDAHYHEALLHWVRYRALTRRDEDTEAKQEALLALAEFERVFGRPVGADVMRHQLESPRMLRFGQGAYYN